MLMESQHWPPDQMLACQRGQLTQLLSHTKANVPFYKSRLDPVFKKNGDIDWNRWNELPILTRTDFKENGAAMMAKVLPQGHGPSYESVSSGTTGSPITIHSTYLMFAAGTAAFARACRWYGSTEDERSCVA